MNGVRFAETRRDHRHSRRRPARPHAGAGGGTARFALPRLFAGKGFLRLRGDAAGTCAAYEDERALTRFAAAVDVITYEFENVPAKTAALLAKRKPVLPDPKVLEITQDRLIEKNFIAELKHRDRALCAGAQRHAACRRDCQGRPAGGAEDAAVRLRRQRPGEDRQGCEPVGGVAAFAQRALHPRRLHCLRARGVGGRRTLTRRHGRMFRRH